MTFTARHFSLVMLGLFLLIAALGTQGGTADSADALGLRKPVILNFDEMPGDPWETHTCFGNAKARVSEGILTIDSPSDCYTFFLGHPNGRWHRHVSNRRGWRIEASLRIDPGSEPDCAPHGTVLIWAYDHTSLVIIGFGPHEICIAYPDQVHFPMDTTKSFHAYRIESKGRQVRVYVDGRLKIDHRLSFVGPGSDLLMFGDWDLGGAKSLTRWDYFSYDVFP